AFGEAQEEDFRTYALQVVSNARALAARLSERGAAIVSGGTDSHMVLVDLRPFGVTGKAAEAALERAGLTCNKNGIPFDPQKPAITSGIRLGTPAGTTRGFGIVEFEQVGDMIADVLQGLAQSGDEGNSMTESRVRGEGAALCARFPIYPGL
ncbi:MAG: serine hydroxymethyltransferase, partial [Azorhizobium sp. 39-67-5]